MAPKKDTTTGTGTAQQWVQCVNCDKWRKVPSNINPDTLPDDWECSNNTWNKSEADCNKESNTNDSSDDDEIWPGMPTDLLIGDNKREREDFYYSITKLLFPNGDIKDPYPIIGDSKSGIPLDLFLLNAVANRLGGPTVIINQSIDRWEVIAESMHLTASDSITAQLKDYYSKYIYQYALKQEAEHIKLQQEESAKRASKGRNRASIDADSTNSPTNKPITARRKRGRRKITDGGDGDEDDSSASPVDSDTDDSDDDDSDFGSSRRRGGGDRSIGRNGNPFTGSRRKVTWTKEEDQALKEGVDALGLGHWTAILRHHIYGEKLKRHDAGECRNRHRGMRPDRRIPLTNIDPNDLPPEERERALSIDINPFHTDRSYLMIRKYPITPFLMNESQQSESDTDSDGLDTVEEETGNIYSYYQHHKNEYIRFSNDIMIPIRDLKVHLIVRLKFTIDSALELIKNINQLNDSITRRKLLSESIYKHYLDNPTLRTELLNQSRTCTTQYIRYERRKRIADRKAEQQQQILYQQQQALRQQQGALLIQQQNQLRQQQDQLQHQLQHIQYQLGGGLINPAQAQLLQSNIQQQHSQLMYQQQLVQQQQQQLQNAVKNQPQPITNNQPMLIPAYLPPNYASIPIAQQHQQQSHRNRQSQQQQQQQHHQDTHRAIPAQTITATPKSSATVTATATATAASIVQTAAAPALEVSPVGIRLKKVADKQFTVKAIINSPNTDIQSTTKARPGPKPGSKNKPRSNSNKRRKHDSSDSDEPTDSDSDYSNGDRPPSNIRAKIAGRGPGRPPIARDPSSQKKMKPLSVYTITCRKCGRWFEREKFRNNHEDKCNGELERKYVKLTELINSGATMGQNPYSDSEQDNQSVSVSASASASASVATSQYNLSDTYIENSKIRLNSLGKGLGWKLINKSAIDTAITTATDAAIADFKESTTPAAATVTETATAPILSTESTSSALDSTPAPISAPAPVPIPVPVTAIDTSTAMTDQ